MKSKTIASLFILFVGVFRCGEKDVDVAQEIDEEVMVVEVLDTLINDVSFLDTAATDFPNSFDSVSTVYSDTVRYDSHTILHPKIKVDGKMYYIVEGDLRLTETEYRLYLRNQKKLQAIDRRDTTILRHKLVGEIRSNKIVRWDEGVELRYAVIKSSFRNNLEYKTVKAKMLEATKDWEKTCNVKFFYDETFDGGSLESPTGKLTFIVRGYSLGNNLIALAFFPYAKTEERKLLIDPVYFSTKYDQTGILRHELGHVLGWRHEHIRTEAPAVCDNEILEGTQVITDYDNKSVMHYFCGDNGTYSMKITDADRLGAQSIYGPPEL